MKSSRMLPVAAICVILILGLVVFRGRGGDSGDGILLESVPESRPPDADSPADTIKTLTARVAAMTSQVEALRGDNDQLRRENQAIREERSQIQAEILRDVTRLLADLETKSQESSSQDLEEIDRLSRQLDELARLVDRSTLAGSAPAGFQEGLGYGAGAALGGRGSDYVWVDPIGHHAQLASGMESPASYPFRTGQGSPSTRRPPHQVYTIPRNATLIDARALTALVGRIPADGQVLDPMPFKVLTGGRNLAANGHEMPDLEGMVWSGTAIGDWSLSCVSGKLESATFIFNDGTVRTVPSTAPSSEAIAWISDAHGLPCIPGKRSTNVRGHLGSLMGIDLVEAAAEATADAQVTESLSPFSDSRRSVTGRVRHYVLGETLGSGSRELANWMASRSTQEFDAVVVPSGQRVAIHVDRQLDIDITSDSRRLKHETTSNQDTAGGVD